MKAKVEKIWESQDEYSHACMMTSGKLRLSVLSSAATHRSSGSWPLVSTSPGKAALRPLLQSTCQLSLLELLVVKALPPISFLSLSASKNHNHFDFWNLLLCLKFLFYNPPLADAFKYTPCLLHDFRLEHGILQCWKASFYYDPQWKTPFLLLKTKGCLHGIILGGWGVAKFVCFSNTSLSNSFAEQLLKFWYC